MSLSTLAVKKSFIEMRDFSRTTIAPVVRLALLCCVAAGCDATTAPIPGPAAPTEAAPSTQDATLESQTWSVILLQGSKVGYHHEQQWLQAGPSQPLRHRKAVDQLSVQRFGQTARQRIEMESWESLDGEVQKLAYRARLGAAPTEVRGVVRDGELVLQRSDSRQPKRLPWPDGTGGYFAVEKSLRAAPMQPGERRTLRALLPLVDQIAEITLVAHQYEPTELPAGAFRLLKIEQRIALAEAPIQATLWADESGELLKQVQTPMTVLRATEELALAAPTSQPLDLGLDVVVPLDRPLPQPGKLARAVYEVRWTDGNPAELLSSGVMQKVEPLDAHTGRVTVETVQPDGNRAAAAQPPTGADSAASSIVQSNAAEIARLARQAVGDLEDARAKAQTLERFVHQYVEQKSYSHAFASASEVAASRAGDCTEHAVLLAALCRAERIPCRVAIGLVYLPAADGFAYHMWNEAWIDGHWLPLDATQGQGFVAADHLKLGQSSLAGASAYTSFLPVLQSLGSLQIRLIEPE